MADKSNAQAVPQEIRKVAETTLATAKDAIDRFMKEATRSYEKVDASVEAARGGARDINHKAIGYAEANVNAAFEFAKKLVRARDPQEIAALHHDFLKRQTEELSTQMRELGGKVMETAKPARPKS